ncbi:DUF192 domain-containing protein [Candidatus Peregrinibacteria bacterium]|nr:DUF192 domain-containing protein [Candidatus Peregrinibacteria bacterium]
MVKKTTTIIADTFLKRLLGAKSLKTPAKGTRIVFPKCRAIHTFGMKYPITVVFTNKEGSELKRITSLPPRRIAIGPKGTYSTIEII